MAPQWRTKRQAYDDFTDPVIVFEPTIRSRVSSPRGRTTETSSPAEGSSQARQRSHSPRRIGRLFRWASPTKEMTEAPTGEAEAETESRESEKIVDASPVADDKSVEVSLSAEEDESDKNNVQAPSVGAGSTERLSTVDELASSEGGEEVSSMNSENAIHPAMDPHGGRAMQVMPHEEMKHPSKMAVDDTKTNVSESIGDVLPMANRKRSSDSHDALSVASSKNASSSVRSGDENVVGLHRGKLNSPTLSGLESFVEHSSSVDNTSRASGVADDQTMGSVSLVVSEQVPEVKSELSVDPAEEKSDEKSISKMSAKVPKSHITKDTDSDTGSVETLVLLAEDDETMATDNESSTDEESSVDEDDVNSGTDDGVETADDDFSYGGETVDSETVATATLNKMNTRVENKGFLTSVARFFSGDSCLGVDENSSAFVRLKRDGIFD